MMDQDVLYFFNQHMDSLPIYEVFESSVKKEITDIRITILSSRLG